MRLGVSLHPIGLSGDGELILRTARHAERLGFDHVIVGQHMLADPGSLEPDPLVFLSAIAGATSRIGVATSILLLPFYEPVSLANQAASLDVLSGGRFTLGVGTGWNAAEFAALGVPFSDRGARAGEHLAVMRELWRHERVDFRGRYLTLANVGITVRPRTPGGPPVLVGGSSDAALRRALRFGDGWVGTGDDADSIGEIRRRLAGLAAEAGEAGRDPSALRLTTTGFLLPPGLTAAREAPGRPLGGPEPTGASVAAALRSLAGAGVASCALWMPVAGPDMTAALDWVAEHVMPGLDGA